MSLLDPDITTYLQGIADLKTGGALNDMVDYARRRFIPVIHQEAADCLLFFLRLQKPRRLLELGTAMGYSACLMVGALPEMTIDTIERDPDMIALARMHFQRLGLTSRINLLEGDIDELLDPLPGPYDFIFIDAGKAHYREYFYSCLSKLTPGGMIVCDNILVRGLVARELVERKHSTIIHRMRQFIEEVSLDARFDSTLLPVGDGLLIIKYKETSQ